MKIELTEQIREILQECPAGRDNYCLVTGAWRYCPLAGACVEYFTGDDSENS